MCKHTHLKERRCILTYLAMLYCFINKMYIVGYLSKVLHVHAANKGGCSSREECTNT